MSTTLHRVHQNFIWRIEAISPTSTICGKNFVRLDPKQIKENESSGLERNFIVTWLGSESDEEFTDQYQRSAEHNFLLQVIYWPGRGWEETHELILQDRNNLIDTLRDDTKYIGYNSENTTTDLSLISRLRESDEIDIDESIWTLRQTWKCLIKEIE